MRPARFLALNSAGETVTRAEKVVSNGLQLASAATVAPDGHIYYVTQRGAIAKLVEVADNNQPVITLANVSPTRGKGPLKVHFKAAATDAEVGQAGLTYRWYLGTGKAIKQQNAKYTYTEPGTYMAILTVSDGAQTTVSETIVIQVGATPTAFIASPAPGMLFRAGQLIGLKGTAIDDGAIVDSDFLWSIRLAHLSHFHPFVTNEVGRVASFAVPTTGHAFNADSSFDIELTVTDQDGLKATKSLKIMPDIRHLGINSDPLGLPVTLDGLPQDEAVSMQSLVGFVHTVTAAGAGCTSEGMLEFYKWSDGSTTISRKIVVPAHDVVLRAVYRSAPDTEAVCTRKAPGGSLPLTFTRASLWFQGARAPASAGIASWSDYHAQELLQVIGTPLPADGAPGSSDVQAVAAEGLQGNSRAVEIRQDTQIALQAALPPRKTNNKYTVIFVAAGKHRALFHKKHACLLLLHLAPVWLA